MDGSRFDDLTKTLATAPSRRTMVKVTGGGVAAALLALVGADGADAARCRNPKSRCGSGRSQVCADTSSDVDHCGGCYNWCARDTCNAPVCSSGTCGTTPRNDTWTCTVDGELGACNSGTCVLDSGGGGGDNDAACVAGADYCLAEVGCAGEFSCSCATTLAGSAFCAAGNVQCFVCTSDTDCVAQYGSGATCLTIPCCSATGQTGCGTAC